MTLQDLKNNRIEIIARIEKIADVSKINEIMTGMVRIVEGGMNDTNSPVELVNEIVELLGYEKNKTTSIDMGEINRANAMKNLPSSMRR